MGILAKDFLLFYIKNFFFYKFVGGFKFLLKYFFLLIFIRVIWNVEVRDGKLFFFY